MSNVKSDYSSWFGAILMSNNFGTLLGCHTMSNITSVFSSSGKAKK